MTLTERIICLDQLRHLSPGVRRKNWLRTCSNEHDKCLARAEALPTRLLDLEVIASRDVKLLDTSDSKVVEGMLRFFWDLFFIPYGTDYFWLQTFKASAMLV